MKSAALILVAVVLAAAAWTAGCSKSQPQKQAPSAGSQSTPSQEEHRAEPGEEGHHPEETPGAEHGARAEVLTPGRTGGEIWKQIAAEQGKLEAAIQAGQLADVHHLAFGIRDLVVSLAGKASGLAAPDAAKLQQAVEQVRQSAAKLDEYGDSGNLSGVKQEYASFREELEVLKGLMGGD